MRESLISLSFASGSNTVKEEMSPSMCETPDDVVGTSSSTTMGGGVLPELTGLSLVVNNMVGKLLKHIQSHPC